MELRAIEVCIEAVQSPELPLSERSAALVLEALAAFKRIGVALDSYELPPDDDTVVGFRAWTNNGASSLQRLLAERPIDETGLLKWAVVAMENIESWARKTVVSLDKRALDPHNPVNGAVLEALIPEIASKAASIKADVDAILIREEAAELVRETRQARDAAQSAAGLTGTASIGAYFSGYARQERLAANTFRILTVVTILAGLFGIGLLGQFEPGNWSAISTRVAIAAATAALGTYFARQAGQHRRLYNWARSTQVQLESFPAFIKPVPEAEQGEVYRVLANRVLSAPPEKGKDTEDSVGSAQLIDLVLTLAKRTS